MRALLVIVLALFPVPAWSQGNSSSARTTFACGTFTTESWRSGGMAYWIAAAREAFEEAGMLFACESSGDITTLDGGERATRIHGYRKRVEEDGLTFCNLLREEGLKLPLKQMTYFSHWITPVGAPRRYDTRFFTCDVSAIAHSIEGKVGPEFELTELAWLPLDGIKDRIQLLAISEIVLRDQIGRAHV